MPTGAERTDDQRRKLRTVLVVSDCEKREKHLYKTAPVLVTSGLLFLAESVADAADGLHGGRG